MRTRTKFFGVTTAACLAVAMGAGPATAAQPTAVGSLAPASSHQVAQALDVTGTTATGEAFTGTISNLTTAVQDGTLVLTGTITDTATGLSQEFTTSIENIVPQEGTNGGGAPGAGGCEILALDLGPLDLDLLGLVVELEPVVLDVTAVPGAGNLLGNLLCAVTGLLDGGPLSGVSALLNRLLTGLGL